MEPPRIPPSEEYTPFSTQNMYTLIKASVLAGFTIEIAYGIIKGQYYKNIWIQMKRYPGISVAASGSLFGMVMIGFKTIGNMYQDYKYFRKDK